MAECFDSAIKALNDLNLTSKDGKALVPVMTAFFKAYQENLNFMLEKSKEDFVKICQQKDATISQFQNQINGLKKKVEKLEEQVDENEAYERRDTLIFSGKKVPTENDSERCEQIVQKLLEDELNYKISPSDVSISHRIGPKKNSQQRSARSIIVKFCRRESKMDVISCARRAKPTDLYINESLIPQRQTVHFALRNARRKFPAKITGCSTIDGSVYAWIKPPASGARDVRVKINTIEKLEDFCQKELDTPLAEILPRQ